MKIFNPFADQPDNPLSRAVKEGYRPLVYAAAFSLVSNLLYLALPLYTFHIYGGVMTSGSVPTLLVITTGVFGAMGGLLTTANDLGAYVAFHLSAWPPRDDAEAGPVKRASVREMAHLWTPANLTARVVDGRPRAGPPSEPSALGRRWRSMPSSWPTRSLGGGAVSL